jgi:outer membrane lipoprotein LolB
VTLRRLALSALVVSALAGCATTPRPSHDDVGDVLSGRMAVRVAASPQSLERSVTAGFELQGRPSAGQLNLSTPLGTMLAQARWAPGTVVLVTPQGERQFPTLDDLTREVLGESIPVAALFDWLKGRPWPGAVSAPTQPPGQPGFVQLGWVINLARFADAGIDAVREQAPEVSVRVKLDRP